MQSKRTTGGFREKQAGEFLEQKGYAVLEYNYRTRMAEVDLICKDKDTFVFVEVKYRSNADEGHPFEAVTPAKQRKLRLAALLYLEDRGLIPDLTPIRFDVVGILEDELLHLENAF